MGRGFIYHVCFLLAALLALAAGCAQPTKVMEQPKIVERQEQVIRPEPEEKPAQPQLPVKRGDLVIISDPSRAEVKIDDKPMGSTPLTLKDVPAGSYRIEMQLEHYETWRGDVDVKDQQMAESRVKLEPKQGTLEVKSEPSGAGVWIDGKDAGVTPYSGSVVAVEEHTVFLSAEGYRFASQKVTVQAEGREVVSIILEEFKEGEMGAPTIIGRDGAEMVLIPAGEFLMGSPEGEGANDEHPQHTVFLDAFYMDRYEVTNAQYKRFMDATGHKALAYWNDEKYNQPDHPVVGVTWYDAKAYCEWAGKRLPTEAEWEKAAQGGLVGKKYPWGDSIDHDNANYYGTGGKDQWSGPAPVGSFAPNGYGLYDMAGNVLEWCADWYAAGYYASSPLQNPEGPDSGTIRVLRGGSWLRLADHLRAAYRNFNAPSSAYYYYGFRGVVSQDSSVTP